MKSICCYCGVREATTKDHVPPKSIFNKPRPHDLITVPCCFVCNNEASKSDETFKAYLGMQVGREGGEAEKLFKEGVIPTARHSNRLKHQILESMYPINTETDAGVFPGTAMAVPWDNDAHDVTIERITKGLFFHHYNKIITTDTQIQTYWFNKMPEVPGLDLSVNSVANGAFTYHYNKVDEADFDSVWIFTFYGGHFAGSLVLSAENKIQT